MTREVAMFVALACFVTAVLWLNNRVTTRLRMARRMGLASTGMARSRVEARFAERSADLRGVFGRLLAGLGGLLPLGEEDRHKIGISLQRAGFGSANAITIVLGVKAVCLLVGLATGLVVVPPWVANPILGWGSGLVAGLLLGVVQNLVPEMVVARLGTLRFRRIQAGLPDAFDLLIVCLESGLTFERALQRTVADLKAFQPDLARELREASLDMSLHGRSRHEALRRLAARLDHKDFSDLATTVGQSERHGTPLAESLRKLASSVRVQMISGMQASVARLPVLLILPTIAFVLPGILVIVGGPALVQLMEGLESFGR